MYILYILSTQNQIQFQRKCVTKTSTLNVCTLEQKFPLSKKKSTRSNGWIFLQDSLWWKAEIKWPLEPWSADPEQVMQESIHIRTAAKKADFPVVVMENLKLLCEQYSLRDTSYWMQQSLKSFSALKLKSFTILWESFRLPCWLRG